jgi:hypothetical protein
LLYLNFIVYLKPKKVHKSFKNTVISIQNME